MPVTTTNAPALEQVLAQLDAFKRKFYLNLLVRGALVAGGLLLTLFVVANLLEYFLYLPTWVRGGLLFGFLGLTAYAFLHWIWRPLAALANLRRLLSDEQAAARVGELFPQVQDKLLNALQLRGQAQENALIAASLEQRAGQLTGLEFARGINITHQSRPLWKYLAVPAGAVALLLLVWPSLFVQGTDRLLHYRRAYAPPAPFHFVIKNKALRAFKNEDFTLEVAIEGQALPHEISIRYGGRERRLTRAEGGNTFTYEFRQLQRDVEFQLSGAGFTSDDYDLTVTARPTLRDFAVQIAYPAYLGKPAETLRNAGNLTVPEGSTVRWDFTTEATDQLQLQFQNPAETLTATAAAGQFRASRRILRSQPYAVRLQNAASLNRDPIEYQITAIPDQVPEVTVESFADTTSLRYLALGGTVRDDYGLTRLQLHYRVTSKARPNAEFRARALPLQSGPSQSYTYQWDLAPLRMQPGDRLEYFVQVWDNDGVHGPKSARTRAAEFRLPSKTELRQQLASQSASVQSQLSKAAEQSKKLERELAKASDKLKTKRELNFQDRKQLQDMLQQKQQMDEQISDMKKLFEELNQKQDQLDPKSQELAEKAKELQKLMDSLLDPETKKLYDQLQKLLQEQKAPDVDMQKLMKQLENKENTLQKELERALEMFKQLQYDQKQEQTTQKLEQLAQEQEKLAEQTEKNDKDNQKGADKNQQQQKQEDLKKQQQEKNQQFDDIKKDLNDLKKLDEQLENQNGADDMKPDQQQVDEQQQNSEEQLGKNQNKKASQSQQKAAQQMKQMAQKMRQQQEQEENDQKQENIDDLRDILENLLKLSFDEESLMKQFRQVDQADPRFVQLGQQQRKLKDDAAVIRDSLYALAKRVPQIQSFVTREVGEMNGRMDESLDQIRQRNVGRATGSQQLAMTSMNNLALMLNDALQQMQQEQRESQQAQQQGGGKPGKKKKKGSAAGDGQMGRMQQQLNQQIQQLQQSGKTGRALSEDLAKLAAQQQMLREALKELEKLQDKGGKGTKDGKGQDGAGGTGDVKKLMEQTETDLVNKRLTEQTVMRQRQILTRLLEVEKSARERDQDEKREAQTAQTRPPVFPPAFDKYKQQKNRQTELLRTVPPALTPYYQREVSEYFQKMK